MAGRSEVPSNEENMHRQPLTPGRSEVPSNEENAHHQPHRQAPASEVALNDDHAHSQTPGRSEVPLGGNDEHIFAPRPELPPRSTFGRPEVGVPPTTSGRPAAPASRTVGLPVRFLAGSPPIPGETFNEFVEMNSVPKEDRPALARFAQMPGLHRELFFAWHAQTNRRLLQQVLESRAESFVVDKDLNKILKAAAEAKLGDPCIEGYSDISPKGIRKQAVRTIGGDVSHLKTAAAKEKMESAVKYHVRQIKATMKRHITAHRVSHGRDVPLEDYSRHIFKGRKTIPHLTRAAIFVRAHRHHFHGGHIICANSRMCSAFSRLCRNRPAVLPSPLKMMTTSGWQSMPNSRHSTKWTRGRGAGTRQLAIE